MATDARQQGELSTGLLAKEAEAVERILVAAESSFQGAGYAATSLRLIAERAEVSKSLVHYHFQSKEHLFLEVLVRIYNRLALRITDALGEQGTPTDRMLFALDALYEALRDNPDFQVQAKVWAHSLTDERLRAHAARLRGHLHDEIVEAMARVLGPAAHQLPMSLPAAADLLWATVSGLGLQAATDAADRVEEAFAGFRELLILSLRQVEARSQSFDGGQDGDRDRA